MKYKKLGKTGLMVSDPCLFHSGTNPSLACVVSGDGQMVHCFGCPEAAGGQPLDAELLAQFANAVLDIGPSMVTAPDTHSPHMAWEIGPEGLKPVTGHLQQKLAQSVLTSCSCTPSMSVFCQQVSSCRQRLCTVCVSRATTM